MAAKANGFVVVEDGAVGCGAIYTWRRLKAGPASLVRQTMEAAGVPQAQLPRPPTPDRALSRAAKRLAKALGLEPKKVDGGVGLYRAGKDGRQGRDLEVLRCSLVDGKTTVEGFGDEGAALAPQASMTLAMLFDGAGRDLTGSDVGAWLTRYFQGADGVSVNVEAGKFWYLPKVGDERAAAVTKALETTGCAMVLRFPAMRSTDTARGVMEGLRDEVAEGARKVQEWVDEQAAAAERGELPQERYRDLREVQVAEILAKVNRYREALRVDVTEVQDFLDGLRAKVQAVRAIAAGAAAGRVVLAGERAMLDLEDRPAEAVVENAGMAPRGKLDLDDRAVR